MPDPFQPLIDRIERGDTEPIDLVCGETVLAEPAVGRLLQDTTG